MTRGPGYGLRGRKHDGLQKFLACCFAIPAGVIAGWLFQSGWVGVLAFFIIFGIVHGLG